MALADVNRDGALDIVTTSRFQPIFSVRLGNGTGGFALPVVLGLPRTSTRDVTVNGVSDCVAVKRDSGSSFCLNARVRSGS